MSRFSDKIKRASRGFCSAVIVAAGASERMGEDKLELMLDGHTVLELSIMALDACESIDELVIVTSDEKLDRVYELCAACGAKKVSKIVRGGATRTESALAGVSETSRRAKIICVHDAARPFATPELIDEVIRAAVLYQAAGPAIPVKDTVRIAEGGEAVETPERANVFAMQTPQAFDADLIKAALTTAVLEKKSYTDDCAAVEALGKRIHLTHGSEDNIKLTTPNDLPLAREIAERRRANAIL